MLSRVLHLSLVKNLLLDFNWRVSTFQVLLDFTVNLRIEVNLPPSNNLELLLYISVTEQGRLLMCVLFNLRLSSIFPLLWAILLADALNDDIELLLNERVLIDNFLYGFSIIQFFLIK